MPKYDGFIWARASRWCEHKFPAGAVERREAEKAEKQRKKQRRREKKRKREETADKRREKRNTENPPLAPSRAFRPALR
jgi:sRNA-binding protein